MQKRPFTLSCVAGLAVSILLLTVQTSRADENAAKAALSAKGIRASRTGLCLQEEGELNKAINAANNLKRKIPSTSGGGDTGEGMSNLEVQAEIAELTQRNIVLNQQVEELNAAPIPYKAPALLKLNQEISANTNAINELKQSSQQATKESDTNQKDVKAARDAYYQAVFDARKMADRVLAQYAELSKDPEAVAAVKAWNESAHTAHALKRSSGFEAQLKRLEALEKKIPSQKIALKQDGTSYIASVAINDVPCEMLVDSSAPNLLLPHQVAVDAGVKVDEAAAMTPFATADGGEVQAHHARLKSVRVGSFMATNVACGVLPASSKTTKAVLGKSFLGQFKGKVDSFSGELSLTRADTEKGSRRRKKPVVKHTLRKRSSKAAQSDEPPQE